MSKSSTDSIFWDQLLQFIEEGCIIPIIGQDLLMIQKEDYEGLLYPYLARRLAEYLDVCPDDLPEGRELNAVACRYLDEPRRRVEVLHAGLKSVIKTEQGLPIPESLLKLAEIRPLKLFVTTTFDSLMQRALDRVRFGDEPRTHVLSFSPNGVVDLPCEVRQLDRPMVFHLLGRVSALPEYAVTEEDLLEFFHVLQGRTRRPELLFDELSRNQLLIIGNHFPDWLTRFMMRTAEGHRLSMARGVNFVADRAVREEHLLLEFLRNFSAQTQVFEDGGPLEFVDQFHERWTRQCQEGSVPGRRQTFSTADRVPDGAIFLSYHNDDHEAVRQIHDDLEAAGLDVWLDREDLHHGDSIEPEIRDRIRKCSLFLPIISRNTLTTEKRFFRLEWRLAQRVAEEVAFTGRFIVPVALDDTPVDDPNLPQAFREVLWYRLRDGKCTPEFVAHIKGFFRRFQKSHSATA